MVQGAQALLSLFPIGTVNDQTLYQSEEAKQNEVGCLRGTGKSKWDPLRVEIDELLANGGDADVHRGEISRLGSQPEPLAERAGNQVELVGLNRLYLREIDK